MTTDAVIIGSGPGGSAAADVLTRAGWSVVIFEKGRNHLLDPDDLTKPAGAYSNDEIKFFSRHFLGPDPLLEPRTFRTGTEAGAFHHVGAVNSIPATVGGGGVHADGKTPRFREDDFRLLSALGPQPGADIVDWPLTYAELEPYYAEAERAVGIAGLAGANPFAAWRSGPYPMPPGAPMYSSVLSSAAAERLGYHPYPAPTAANSVPYDGRPACNNCGFCAFFGCPIHAKGDPVALLTRTIATGRAELRPETFVSRIVVKNGRATGVEYIGADGETRTMDARHVIVAAGAIETPRLLLLSGLEHPLIGRYLMTHYQTITVGIVPERLHGYRGRSVTHIHDDPIMLDEPARLAAKEAELPWIRGGIVEHASGAHAVSEARIYPRGPGHNALMRQSPMRDHMAAFIMQGEDLPYPTNQVDLDPTVRDVRGFPVARVTYRGGRHEHAASAHHGARHLAILKEMGATWTMMATSPGEPGEGRRLPPIPESKHVMGTTRMGADPATSVVDPWSRVHGLENVVIADSSVFVTAAGYGPTLTLVALSVRAAAHLAGTELTPTIPMSV